jgi:nicotinamidase-related amidase
MVTREKYLSNEWLDEEINNIIHELNQSGIKTRKWNGILRNSALIVTDLQNYFLSSDSHAFIPSAEPVIPNIQKLIEIFRNNNRPVIFTKHINDEDNAQSMNYWWKDLVREGTPSAGFYGNLCLPDDIIITKHQYDAFHQTELEKLLIENSVMYPVICGVMANLCCETTVRSAFVQGFRPVLPIDATAAYNRDLHIATFRNLAFGFSPLMTTQEIIDQLQP